MISIPRGTRDFLPKEAARRKFIFNVIENTFIKYGYQKIETPALEMLDVLMGKYGEEGDRLIFKLLGSREDKDVAPDKGLRYDLTVPLARVVAMHDNELTFPFKRYQMQQVWRADRPQKGRYREFTQCDIDVIGSKSILNEVEFIQIINDIFNTLNIKVDICINNRKVLEGISEYLNVGDKFIKILTILDKLDKIGISEVRKELMSSGFSVDLINKLATLIELTGTNYNNINELRDKLSNGFIGTEGLNELETLLEKLDLLKINNVFFDVSMVRGLSYYTGTIIEVKPTEVKIGSVCGGGRYDNLTSIFKSKKEYEGVGISFGADRIYDVMEELNLFPINLEVPCTMMFANFGDEEIETVLPIATELRKKGMSIMIYPDSDGKSASLKKQFSYASKLGISYVAVIGKDEIANETITIKMMETGNQYTVTLKEFLEK